MKKSFKQISRNKGFTLIEVIVVVVIIAILAAIAVPALTKYIGSANEKRVLTEARQCVQTAQLLVIERLETGAAVTGDAAFIAEVKDRAEVPTSGVIDSLILTEHTVTELTYTNDGITVKYENGTYTVLGSSGSAGRRPDSDLAKTYVYDPVKDEYVELAVQGTGIGATSSAIAKKLVYYEGGKYGEAGYYYISGAQYSGNITDIDAYLDRMAAWADGNIRSNFVKIDTDAPIQTYDAATETSKPRNERNSSVVKGQVYYIDFAWDDVAGPVKAVFIGSTSDTWWRGDMTSTETWPTNKGIWAILE